MYSQTIIDGIRDANPSRSPDCIRRRLLKVLEELGEVSEAYVATTAENNYKNKTWADFREEACDTLIVMVDVALTALPNTSYPPVAFLPLHINDGRTEAASSFADMEDIKFDIARAVCSADRYLHQKDGEMGFYGAVARGVKASARLCYTRVPGYDNGEIEHEVQSTIKRKLEKWKSRSTATVSAGQPKIVEPVVEVIDAKTFFEQIMDRNL